MDVQEILWRLSYRSVGVLSCVSRNFNKLIKIKRRNLAYWRSEFKIDRPLRVLPSVEAYEIYYLVLHHYRYSRPGIFTYDAASKALEALKENKKFYKTRLVLHKSDDDKNPSDIRRVLHR